MRFHMPFLKFLFHLIISRCNSSLQSLTGFTGESLLHVFTSSTSLHGLGFFFFFSSESGYLSCSFDDGLCGWIRDKDGDLHWETTPDPSGNRGAGVVCFIISKSKWEELCSFYWHAHICKHPHTQSKQFRLVLLNYRSRWKLLKGNGLSFLQIRALLYKAMQMRSGLHDSSVIPVAYIKWEHDTVFLGVQTKRKRNEVCWTK